MMKILLQKKFVLLVLLSAFIVMSGSAVPAYAHFLEGDWESQEFQYLGETCLISLHFDGTNGTCIIDFLDTYSQYNFFIGSVVYGDSSVECADIHDSSWNSVDDITIGYERKNDDTVEFENFVTGSGYLTCTRQFYNDFGDTSLLSGAGCNSGGLWTIFCGLIVLVGYRKQGTR